MSRRKASIRTRQLGTLQTLRLLASGGMIRLQKGVWSVYRRPDARLMRAGFLDREQVRLLVGCGAARPDGSDVMRLVAGPGVRQALEVLEARRASA
jgi:hypothetical protein